MGIFNVGRSNGFDDSDRYDKKGHQQKKVQPDSPDVQRCEICDKKFAKASRSMFFGGKFEIMIKQMPEKELRFQMNKLQEMAMETTSEKKKAVLQRKIECILNELKKRSELEALYFDNCDIDTDSDMDCDVDTDCDTDEDVDAQSDIDTMQEDFDTDGESGPYFEND